VRLLASQNGVLDILMILVLRLRALENGLRVDNFGVNSG
jgi:hypothetical protein